MGLFGYTDAQWNAAKEEMRQALIHTAREEDTMSYTELTTKILDTYCARRLFASLHAGQAF